MLLVSKKTFVEVFFLCNRVKFYTFAVDDIEIGTGHRVPLWMFGLLY